MYLLFQLGFTSQQKWDLNPHYLNLTPPMRLLLRLGEVNDFLRFQKLQPNHTDYPAEVVSGSGIVKLIIQSIADLFPILTDLPSQLHYPQEVEFESALIICGWFGFHTDLYPSSAICQLFRQGLYTRLFLCTYFPNCFFLGVHSNTIACALKIART